MVSVLMLLTKKEIKYIIKVIRSFENREILLKRTTRKITSQEQGFLDFLSSLVSTGLPLMENVLTPLAKRILVPLGLTKAVSARDVAIQKKIFGYGMKILIFSNEELDDIIKMFKSLEEAGLLIKRVSEAVENEVKEQKGGFLGMLAATLGASLFGNTVAGRGMKSKIPEREATIPGPGVIRAGEGSIRGSEGTTRVGKNF